PNLGMPALTCQLTYRDPCGAAGAWTRVLVASVGPTPILLKVQTPLFGQIRRDRQPVDGLEDHLAVSRASPITSANPVAGLDANAGERRALTAKASANVGSRRLRNPFTQVRRDEPTRPRTGPGRECRFAPDARRWRQHAVVLPPDQRGARVHLL